MKVDYDGTDKRTLLGEMRLCFSDPCDPQFDSKAADLYMKCTIYSSYFFFNVFDRLSFADRKRVYRV